jgi:hypothetical protein
MVGTALTRRCPPDRSSPRPSSALLRGDLGAFFPALTHCYDHRQKVPAMNVPQMRMDKAAFLDWAQIQEERCELVCVVARAAALRRRVPTC